MYAPYSIAADLPPGQRVNPLPFGISAGFSADLLQKFRLDKVHQSDLLKSPVTPLFRKEFSPLFPSPRSPAVPPFYNDRELSTS